MTNTIGVSLNIGSHAWYQRQVLAERRVAEEAGFDLSIRDADDDAAGQLAQIIELLDSGIAALIVSATNVTAIRPGLDACKARGVPVIGESIAIDHPAVVAEVRVDDVAAGVELGRAVAAALRTKVANQVTRVTCIGFPRLAEGHDRERGFLEGLRDSIPDLVTVSIDGRAQVAFARSAVARIYRALPGTEQISPHVLFGVDDESVVGALQGFDEIGISTKRTIRATYGISPPSGPALIDAGVITFGAAMFPEWHGETLINLALASIRGEEHERLVHPASAVVTARGTPRGWDRFYRQSGTEYELDRDAVIALSAG